MRKKRQQYPQILAEVAVEVTRLLMARGEEEEAAMEFGFEVAEFIRRHWAGQALYIPRGQEFFLSNRDQEILQEYNGGNLRDLSIKHGLSTVRIYQILKAGRIKQAAEARTNRQKKEETA